MNRETFALLENYMLSCCGDSAHDKEHLYRVLDNALTIGREEPGVDWDILIAACLLHDVGRPDQFADPSVCHAEVGSEKAYGFLREQGFSEEFAQQVRHCVLSHRFRKARPPQTLEAKILFDADKLDATGALGMARTLMFKSDNGGALYCRNADGSIDNGTGDGGDSLFREYKFKLEKLYDRYFTATGARLAQERKRIAEDFYQSLLREVTAKSDLGDFLED
jgi:uncharacterized protein